MTQFSHDNEQPLLRSLFAKGESLNQAIGLEAELAVLDPETGVSVPYEGPKGLQNLLKTIATESSFNCTYEKENLMILSRDGFSLQLEHGGAIEYSSKPATNLKQLVADLKIALRLIVDAASRLGVAVVPGGNFPFNTPENTSWVPKHRGRIMRDYFEALGDAGAGGLRVMSETLSTQVTLDYASETDMSLKLRTLVAAAPIVSAMFSNSPLDDGRPSGALSRRAEHYFTCDPKRSGFVPPALGRLMSFTDFIEWALDMPMIYRATPSGYESADSQTFRTVLRDGFADHTRPDEAHWRSHLSQIYTDVRLRDTIELRAVDGAPVNLIPAVVALWTGLAYHRPSLLAAWELFSQKSVKDHHAALREIPFKGLHAHLGGDPVIDIARELLRLAKDGFNARIAAGLEDPSSLTYFEPLAELLDSRVTLAERCLLDWEGRLGKTATRYVDAYRVNASQIENL